MFDEKMPSPIAPPSIRSGGRRRGLRRPALQLAIDHLGFRARSTAPENRGPDLIDLMCSQSRSSAVPRTAELPVYEGSIFLASAFLSAGALPALRNSVPLEASLLAAQDELARESP